MAQVSQRMITKLEMLLICFPVDAERYLLDGLKLRDVERLLNTSAVLANNCHILNRIIDQASQRAKAWAFYMAVVSLYISAPRYRPGDPKDHWALARERWWMKDVEHCIDPSLALIKKKAPVYKRRQWYKKVVRGVCEQEYQAWNNLPLPDHIQPDEWDPQGIWRPPRYVNQWSIGCDVPRCPNWAFRSWQGHDVPRDEQPLRVLHYCANHDWQIIGNLPHGLTRHRLI